jgi:hypothetical protein
MGLCWQHLPVKKKADREKWKTRIEGAALVVAASELLVKIIELATNHLTELFGESDDKQTKFKEVLQRKFGSFSIEMMDEVNPGARVDWQMAYTLVFEAEKASVDEERILFLEKHLIAWFDNLDYSFQKALLDAVQRTYDREQD